MNTLCGPPITPLVPSALLNQDLYIVSPDGSWNTFFVDNTSVLDSQHEICVNPNKLW